MRSFLYSVFFFLTFLISVAQETQPNVIWLVCEDQSPDFFPMYGDATVSLPNIEALAEDSIIYNNMHATTPVCAPARSAIITGMYPTTLGTHNMRAFNEGRSTNQPSLGIPSYSPEFPDYIRPFTTYLRESGYYCTNSNKQDYNFKISADAWDQTCRYCKGAEKAAIHWRNRDEKQAFFAVFNFQITHEAQIWHQQNLPLYVDPKRIDVPPYFPDDAVVRKDMAVNYSNLVRMDGEVGAIIDELKESGLYDDSYIFFYSDHGGPFPRHKRAIYNTGTKVPFMIKLPKSKNAGKTVDELLSFIDLAPTVLSIAQLPIPEHIQGVDILDVKRKERDYIVTASDRFDEQVDRIRAIQTKRYKLIKNFIPSKPHAIPVGYRENMPMMQQLNKLYASKSLNSIQEQWFSSPKAPFEFYDLKNDPFELNNLAGSDKYKRIIKKLHEALNEWIVETDDLGEVPESTIIKKSTLARGN